MIIDDLMSNNIKKIKTYIPSQTIEQISEDVGISVDKILKIDSGENFSGETLQNKQLLEKINFYLYPDPACTVLRQKLSSYTGYDKKWILCGNGSDELIDLLIRTFVSRGEEIIIFPPTFSMYAFYGQLSGAKIKSVFRGEDLYIDTAGIRKKITGKTKIIFIDSPGNPSSVIISSSDMEALLKRKVIVVADEAYFEYCGKTVLPLVRKYSNLIVLRTFSKWAGLAGLRIGYMIANPKVINLIMSIKPPYNVNSAAQIMASSVLDNRKEFLSKVKQMTKSRNELISRLSEFSELKVYPSDGAYVIFKPTGSVNDLYNFLRRDGILVKVINQTRFRNCIRINLIDKENINKFIFHIRRFYEN